jgi:signal transduction histidine kinase
MTSPLPTHSSGILSPLPSERVIARFAIALVSAALAIFLRAALEPVLGHVAFYCTVYMAVAFCAVVCGFAPAVLCTLVGFGGIFYLFVDPRHSASIRPPEIHGVIGFFLVSAVLTMLGGAHRRKQMKLDATVAALTKEAAERKRAEEELQQAHDALEQRVQERTAELSQALARLESEISVREQTEEQLRQLSVRLMTLQDEERRRIARDLHDTTGQTLAAIKMTLAMLQRNGTNAPDLQRLVGELNDLADEALQEVRTTSYLLHPPMLDEVGIASATRWFVEGFAKRSGIKVQCDIPDPMERPPRHCELVLFRVLQESLTNVHRHSGASAASIALRRDTDHLRLEVSDNGRGIPEERVKRFKSTAGTAGVGIAGMRERVRELGGRLDIRSDTKGTTVSVTVPMTTTPVANETDLRVSTA